MGFKDNISMVKNELGSEEKFFASALQIESFVTKYKKLLIILAVIIVVALIADVVHNYEQAQDIKLSNIAFLKLQKNPQDTQALHVLKEDNQNLYNIYVLNKAVANSDMEVLQKLSHVKTLFVADLASYQLASLKKNRKLLDAYSHKNNAIYKQIAILQSAYLLIKAHHPAEANVQLKTIAISSPINQIAKILSHYGIK